MSRIVSLSESHLAPYAAKSTESRGRQVVEPPPNMRTEYQRDRDRIVHSAAFRRLVYKTQVFVNHEGDFYRNRLTHSLEVAQIARTIARALKLNEDLVEAISLAHDLGHTPFGHAGQDALNFCMREYGGFEHNLQSLRVVDQLEEKYNAFPGLNLTFETREGILKHCSVRNARDLGSLGERFLNRTQPGLEAQLANLADEIAYNNHDVDDGLRSSLISIDELREVPLFNQHYQEVTDKYPESEGRPLIHETIGGMIGALVSDVVNTTTDNLYQHKPQSVDEVRALKSTVVDLSGSIKNKHLELKRFLNKRLYKHPKVRSMTDQAEKTIKHLFISFFDNPTVLPNQYSQRIADNSDESHRARVIADYIAGMTDRYAIAEYERLLGG
ncbi:MAG: deoxyguanosinetriphosphate triphosphohydrolase [Pseudomonadota bacterium]